MKSKEKNSSFLSYGKSFKDNSFDFHEHVIKLRKKLVISRPSYFMSKTDVLSANNSDPVQPDLDDRHGQEAAAFSEQQHLSEAKTRRLDDGELQGEELFGETPQREEDREREAQQSDQTRDQADLLARQSALELL